MLLLWALIVPHLDIGLQPIAFDAGVALVGGSLVAGLRSRGDLTEHAIELDESTGTFRDALAKLLRDPTLQIGFEAAPGEFVDELGRTIAPDAPSRRTTQLPGLSGAVVIHDPAVLTAHEDREAISVALALAATRARLRHNLGRRADELARSMATLIHAEDDERMQIAARLAPATGDRLDKVSRLVADARAIADSGSELDESLRRAAEQLERATQELDALAGGLGVPALVAGLPSALRELVARLPVDVQLRTVDIDGPDELAATIWFVCAEGVANVMKHAGASRLLLEVADAGAAIRVLMQDDGRGGADATGSGLSGLRDRVAALGGSLDIESSRGSGTRLIAMLPRSGATG